MTNEELISVNIAQQQQIEGLKSDIERKGFLIEEKDFIIAKLQKMLFGATSEKQNKKEEIPPNQIYLFTN